MVTLTEAYTVAEAARVLKTSTRSLRRWLTNGTIRGQKLGRQWRIPLSELARVLPSETDSRPRMTNDTTDDTPV
jgi:excisionase family DNA binding protein